MNITRFLTLLLIGLLALSGSACSGDLDESDFDNPFDPINGGAGQIFVSALYSNAEIIVSWTVTPSPAVSAFEIWHSVAAGGPFDLVGTVSGSLREFTHTDFAAGLDNFYKIRARDRQGGSTLLSAVTAAQIPTPPTFMIDTATPITPTRFVDLDVLSALGDSMAIASDSDFTNPVWFDLKPDSLITILDWDLGSAAGNGEMKRVFLNIPLPGGSSLSNGDSVVVSFGPALTLTPPGFTVSDTLVKFVSANGKSALRMRVAPSLAELDLAPWFDYVDTLEYTLSAATTDTQKIFAEYESDFGFTTPAQTFVLPKRIDNPVMSIASVISGDDPGITSTPEVEITAGAPATEMRFAESPDFTGVPWIPFAVETNLTLGAGFGVHRIYGMFRNPWFTAAVLDSIEYVGGEAP